MGSGIILGTLAGVLVFSITQQYFWVLIGLSLGILVAAILDMQNRNRSPD